MTIPRPRIHDIVTIAVTITVLLPFVPYPNAPWSLW